MTGDVKKKLRFLWFLIPFVIALIIPTNNIVKAVVPPTTTTTILPSLNLEKELSTIQRIEEVKKTIKNLQWELDQLQKSLEIEEGKNE